MLLRNSSRGRRRGAAALETALVMIPLCMFLFGTFEYGRLLMHWNLVNNAAREGCRYALVNNTSATITADVLSVVTTYMGGQDANFTNFTVSLSGAHNSTSVTDVTTLVPGDTITVQVSGIYKFMNVIPKASAVAPVTISSTVTMQCEGGN